MSPIEAAVLRSVVLPSVGVGIGLVLTGALREPTRRIAQAVLIAAAFTLGSYLLIEHLTFPPADVNESFTYVAWMLAAFVALAPTATGPRYLTRVVVAGLGLSLLLYHIKSTLGGTIAVRNLIGFFALASGVWSITEAAAARVGRPALAVTALVAGTAASLVALLKGGAVFAQLIGITCGSLGASLAVSVIWPKRVASDAVVPFASVFLVLAMAATHFYLDINPWHLLACAWPFALLWARPWLPLPRQPHVEALIFGVLAAGPLGYFVYQLFLSAGPLY